MSGVYCLSYPRKRTWWGTVGKHLHFLAIAAGAALLLVGVGFDRDPADLAQRLGLVGLLIGLDILLCRRPQPVEATGGYEIGYHDGHRDGYDEGRHKRPVVVPFPADRLCSPNVERRGRHAARCRDNCTADALEAVGQVGSQEWDGAS